MGHRLSKSIQPSEELNHNIQEDNTLQSVVNNSNINPLQLYNQNIEQSTIQQQTVNINQNLPTTTFTLQPSSINTSLNNSNTGRRIIIKIQLTKMEPENSLQLVQQTDNQKPTYENVENFGASTSSNSCTSNNINNSNDLIINNNLNITNRPQIINLAFTKNIPCDLSMKSTTTSSGVVTSQQQQQNGNSEIKLNNFNTIDRNNIIVGNSINNNFFNNFNNSNNDNENNELYKRLNNCNLNEEITCENSQNDTSIQQNGAAEYQDLPDINQRVGSNINFSSNNDERRSPANSNRIDSKNSSSCNNLIKNSKNSSKSKSNMNNSTMCGNHPDDQKSHCCRRKKSSSSSAYPSKWRCCKCACRDAVKKIVDGPSTSSSSSTSASTCNNLDKKLKTPASKSNSSWTSRFTCSKKENNTTAQSQQQQSLNPVQEQESTHLIPQVANSQSLVIARPQLSDTTIWSPGQINPQQQQPSDPNAMPRNHLAFWAPNEVVFPITTRSGDAPQMLVLQLPQVSQLVLGRIEDLDERARQLRAIEIETGVDNLTQPSTWPIAWCSQSGGLSFASPTVVHSQVDYIHCLVPDLEKITSSSFYWGKMDRYEAERLLEGKPEGTFLLRDSAQEEYLFSVTFRKYGRSLHARIEQFNHKFSFDCHDPGVFTAPTVTGLLEHYKDPSCVMFFEPMLTIPLNRNFSFSLQQLCRATIVSNINYDGINELQLPNSLKSYLKEYHYKLRVRVKPFDEPYSCS